MSWNLLLEKCKKERNDIVKFFTGKEVNDFVKEIHEKMKQEVLELKDSEILTCDFEQWADYLASKYYIEPIKLFEDNIDKTMSEAKVKRYNHWARTSSYEPEYYMIDGYRITFVIPFDGNEKLLQLKPSTFKMTSFEVASMQGPYDNSCGSFSLEFFYTAQELQEKTNVNEFVESKFKHEFENYRKMITYVNSEVEQYNKGIRSNALQLLDTRKKKATSYAALSQSLNIPMKLSSNAPNIVPLPLKHVVRQPISKPTSKPLSKDYCIADDDYRNIVNIIHNVCASMEATARTFNNTGEEEIRDFILATLGTHYVNMVTGETFRKVGKTDIHIVFENKAAFIGECKIWHGIKKFEEAIEQLFGYSTWKDTKTALIVFNKENKDFVSIQQNVLSWIKSNAKRYEVKNGNIWSCVLHREDTNTDVQVAIALYDITI